MSWAINISQFQIPFEGARQREQLVAPLSDMLQEKQESLSTSVWRNVADRDDYLRLTFFPDFDTMTAFFDRVQKNPQLLDMIRKFGLAPDVTRSNTVWSMHFDPTDLHQHEYVSLSMRAMDPGYGPDWIDKLTNNLVEVSVLPGFNSALIGQTADLPDQVAGMVFWRSEDAFRQSVPKNPDYPIHLYERYR